MVIKKQNKQQQKSSYYHVYVTYTVPALSFTFKTEKVDSCPFWISGFFSSSRLFMNVNVNVGDG